MEERCDILDILDMRFVYICELRIVCRRAWVPASGKYSCRLWRFFEMCMLSGLKPLTSVKLFLDFESLEVSESWAVLDLWRFDGLWTDMNLPDEMFGEESKFCN